MTFHASRKKIWLSHKNYLFLPKKTKETVPTPKDTRKLVVIDEEEPGTLGLSSCSSVWDICGKLYLWLYVDLAREFFAVLLFNGNSCFMLFFGTSTARGRSKLDTMIQCSTLCTQRKVTKFPCFWCLVFGAQFQHFLEFFLPIFLLCS